MSKQKSENTVTDSRSIAVVLRTDEPIHQSQKFQTVQKRNYDEKPIDPTSRN